MKSREFTTSNVEVSKPGMIESIRKSPSRLAVLSGVGLLAAGVAMAPEHLPDAADVLTYVDNLHSSVSPLSSHFAKIQGIHDGLGIPEDRISALTALSKAAYGVDRKVATPEGHALMDAAEAQGREEALAGGWSEKGLNDYMELTVQASLEIAHSNTQIVSDLGNEGISLSVSLQTSKWLMGKTFADLENPVQAIEGSLDTAFPADVVAGVRSLNPEYFERVAAASQGLQEKLDGPEIVQDVSFEGGVSDPFDQPVIKIADPFSEAQNNDMSTPEVGGSMQKTIDRDADGLEL